MEDTGSVLLQKFIAGILGVHFIEEILDKVGQPLSLMVVGRRKLILQLGCGEVELVLNLRVIGHYEVVVEPLVEGGRSRCVVNSRCRGVISIRLWS